MRDRIVAHPDHRASPSPDLQERFPGFVPQSRHGPVDQVQIHVLETEFASGSPRRRATRSRIHGRCSRVSS